MNFTVIVIGILQDMIMTGISSIDIQTLAVLKRLLQVRNDIPSEVQEWIVKEISRIEKNKVDF